MHISLRYYEARWLSGKTIIHSSFVSRYYVNKRRKIFRKLLKNTLNCRKICKLKKN